MLPSFVLGKVRLIASLTAEFVCYLLDQFGDLIQSILGLLKLLFRMFPLQLVMQVSGR